MKSTVLVTSNNEKLSLGNIKDFLSWDKNKVLGFLSSMKYGNKITVEGENYTDDEVKIEHFKTTIEKFYSVEELSFTANDFSIGNLTFKKLNVKIDGLSNLLKSIGNVRFKAVGIINESIVVELYIFHQNFIEHDGEYTISLIVKEKGGKIIEKSIEGEISTVFSLIDELNK